METRLYEKDWSGIKGVKVGELLLDVGNEAFKYNLLFKFFEKDEIDLVDIYFAPLNFRKPSKYKSIKEIYNGYQDGDDIKCFRKLFNLTIKQFEFSNGRTINSPYFVYRGNEDDVMVMMEKILGMNGDTLTTNLNYKTTNSDIILIKKSFYVKNL